jgi:hypothetical protein
MSKTTPASIAQTIREILKTRPSDWEAKLYDKPRQDWQTQIYDLMTVGPGAEFSHPVWALLGESEVDEVLGTLGRCFSADMGEGMGLEVGPKPLTAADIVFKAKTILTRSPIVDPHVDIQELAQKIKRIIDRQAIESDWREQLYQLVEAHSDRAILSAARLLPKNYGSETWDSWEYLQGDRVSRMVALDLTQFIDAATDDLETEIPAIADALGGIIWWQAFKILPARSRLKLRPLEKQIAEAIQGFEPA